MNDLERVHSLLYYGFLSIRGASEVAGDKISFRLADLLHNVPLQLAQVANGKLSYLEVLNSILERATDPDDKRWVEWGLKEIETSRLSKTE